MEYGVCQRNDCSECNGQVLFHGRPVYIYLEGLNKETGKYLFATAHSFKEADRMNYHDFDGEASIFVLFTRDSQAAKTMIRKIRHDKLEHGMGEILKPVYNVKHKM